MCVREHKNHMLCVTVSIESDYRNAVSKMDFKLYKLDSSGNISQLCIGKSPCEICENCFIIIDIGIMEDYRDNGFGNVLLSEIIKYADNFKVDRIVGKISYMDIKDEDSRDRLIHFYKSYGFIVDDELMKLVYYKTDKNYRLYP